LNILTRDTATLMVVKEFLVREMKARDMRNTDISKVLPFAIQLSFVPHRDELDARDFAVQESYFLRDREGNTPRHGRRKWWILNWFGPKMEEPQFIQS